MKGEDIYETMGHVAKKNGTIISVIGIEGSDCSMVSLGKCAAITSGAVNIVKPLELQRKMRALVDNPVLGTDVSVKVFTHPSLEVMSLTIEVMVSDESRYDTTERERARSATSRRRPTSRGISLPRRTSVPFVPYPSR